MFSNIFDRIRLLFRRDKESYLRFYRMLGFFPHDISLYEQALLHKSLSVKEKGRLQNNERLEFLGDAILDAVIAEILYRKFPGKREGFLTNTRSKIVQRETLNKVAKDIGLDKLIKYASRQYTHNSYVSGNAFEALIGAIYLDRGYRYTRWFIEQRIIHRYLNVEKISRKEMNFKSKLIEWGQKNKFDIVFDLTKQEMDDGFNPVFETLVLVGNVPAGTGKGYSKKESQQEAASKTLKMLRHDPLFIERVFAEKAAHEESLEQGEVPSVPKPATTEAMAPIAERPGDEEDLIAQAEAKAFEEYA